MRPRLIVKPALEPINLQDFLDHAGISAGQDDIDAQSKLTAATRAVEWEAGRGRLLKATWEYRLERFPADGHIDLPLAQVQSVTHVKYTDSAGSLQTMTAGDYHLVGGYSPVVLPDTAGINDQITYGARIFLKYGKVWPSASLETGEPIVITFIAGWQQPENIPEDLKAAIFLEGGHLYSHGESVTVGDRAELSSPLARGVRDICARYKPRFYA